MSEPLSTFFHQEIQMFSKRAFMSASAALGAALVTSTLFAGPVAAEDVTVAYKVSAKGLDLKQPTGAREFYTRVRHAAWIVCTGGNRVGLQPLDDPQGCYEKALADAIRSLNMARITEIYLQTHSPWVAAAHGIEVPLHIATK